MRRPFFSPFLAALLLVAWWSSPLRREFVDRLASAGPADGGGLAAAESAPPEPRGDGAPPASPRAAVLPMRRSQAPTSALQFALPRSFEATLTFNVQAPKFTANEWVVYCAQPPLLAGQTSASVHMLPGGKTYDETADPNRPLLRTLVAGKGAHQNSLDVRLEYRATLRGRRLVSRQPGVVYEPPERLTAADRKRFLQTNSLFDFDTVEFDHWLNDESLHWQGQEADIDFARRVFHALLRELRYEYHNTMDRRATHVAATRASDCAGMSVLFAATMRAHGIPARVLAGRWARSARPGQIVGDVKYHQQHVKAEFYAEGVGWVPVNLSSAVQRQRTREAAATASANPTRFVGLPAETRIHDAEALEYFGHDAGNFLVVHIDPLVTVNTLHFGRKTLDWLQGVHYYAQGQGSLRGNDTDETWRVDWLQLSSR